MKRIRKRKCRHCKELYHPDHRNRRHQQHCSKPACGKASKQGSQRRWLSKPENQNYFQGSEQVHRVRAWRQENPGYWRSKRTGTLQDVLVGQGAEMTKESGSYLSGALQDVFMQQPLVMIGLIAQLNASALQDDIAFAARKLLRLGQDIMEGKALGGRDDPETTHLPRASALSAPSVQLGGPASGP